MQNFNLLLIKNTVNSNKNATFLAFRIIHGQPVNTIYLKLDWNTKGNEHFSRDALIPEFISTT